MEPGEYKIYRKPTGEQIRVRIVRTEEDDKYTVSSGAATYIVGASSLLDEAQAEEIAAQDAENAPQEAQAPPLTTTGTAGEANTNPDAAATDQAPAAPTRTPRQA